MKQFRRLRVQKSRHSIDFAARPKRRFRMTWKRFFGGLFIAFFLVIAWTTYAGVKSFKNFTEGDNSLLKLFGRVDADSIKNDHGRTNIIVLGIGGDGHPGSDLTDSMLLASIDSRNKQLALISIPRDLYVNIPERGKAKINVAYSFGQSNKKNKGAETVKQTIEQTFDLPVHYYITVDFEAFVKLIDAVNGVTVDVPRAINDPYFPDDRMKGYAPFRIKAGEQTMDGKTALKYSRSRETTSDFDRSRRQQLVIVALKEKLFSLGTLTNPRKLTEILNILGKNVKTDLGSAEIKYLASISEAFRDKPIVNKVFDTSTQGGLVSTNFAGYTLSPNTGNFKAMSTVLKQIFYLDKIEAEKPTIYIKKTTSSRSDLSELNAILNMMGFNITRSESISTSQKKSVIESKGDKPNSESFLKEILNISTVKKVEDAESVDFTVELGADYVKPKNY